MPAPTSPTAPTSPPTGPHTPVSAPPAAGTSNNKQIRLAAIITVVVVLLNSLVGCCGMVAYFLFPICMVLGLVSATTAGWAGYEYYRARQCGSTAGMTMWLVIAISAWALGSIGFILEVVAWFMFTAEIGR